MPTHRRSRPRLFVLLLALCLLPIIAFAASFSWLKQQSDEMVFLVSGVTATVVIVASFLLAILHEQQLDEVNRTNLRFSAHWGWGTGTSLVALLLVMPPFGNLILSTVAHFTGEAHPDREVVIFSFVAGFIAIVIAQTVCMAVASIGWTLWKSRPAREA